MNDIWFKALEYRFSFIVHNKLNFRLFWKDLTEIFFDIIMKCPWKKIQYLKNQTDLYLKTLQKLVKLINSKSS